MIFLDDFLEMLEELPGELRERCREIKDIDAEITEMHSSAGVEVDKFFAMCEGMKEEDRSSKLKELQSKYAYLRSRSEQKIALSEKMQELLEKYTQHLEKEKMHLKFELEADNAGVTESIERRFAAYVDQMFSMRKERRKRAHASTSSNGVCESSGGGGGGGASNNSDSASGGHAASVSLPPTSSKLTRLDSTSSDAAATTSSTTMPSTPATPLPRARKHSMPVTAEESALKEARREAIRNQLQATLHMKATNGGEKDKGWSSPSGRSIPSPSTPSGTNGQFVFSSHTSPQTAVISPGHSSMPNFISTESRHGRARKLTSRVQEMFNSNHSLAGHRERSRHTSTTHSQQHACSASSSTSSAHGRHPSTSPDDDAQSANDTPRARDDGDDDGNDERPWCICHEKSYGEMVACDNRQCPYEWFHWPCVGLSAVPKGKWYCPSCVDKTGSN